MKEKLIYPLRYLILAFCLLLGMPQGHAQQKEATPRQQAELKALFARVDEEYVKKDNLAGLDAALKPVLEKALEYNMLDGYYQGTIYRTYYLINSMRMEEALDYLNKVVEFSHTHFSYYGIYSINRTLAVLYRFQGDYNLSIEKFREAIGYARKYMPSLDTEQNYASMCVCYRKLMDYEGLLNTVNEGLKHRSPERVRDRSKLVANKAYALYALGRYEEFRRSYKDFEALPESHKQLVKHVTKSVTAFKRLDEGKVQEARDIIHTITDEAELELAYIICARKLGKQEEVNQSLRRLLVVESMQKTVNLDMSMAVFGIRVGELNQALDEERAKSRNTQLELKRAQLKLANEELELNELRAAEELASHALRNDSVALHNQLLQQVLVRDSLKNQQQREKALEQEHSQQQTFYYVGAFLSILVALLSGILLRERSRQRRRLRKLNWQLQQTNADLQLANAEAQESNLQKEKFIQTISHEVRTPLNAIVGFSQVLDEMGDNFSMKEKAEFTRYIAESSEVLSKLIGDVLDLTSIESGRYVMKHEQVPVKALCEDAVAQCRSLMAPGVELRYNSTHTEELTMPGDRQRMLQVLTNLLSNAAKFTTQGSITLASVLSAEKMTFSVTDTGEGVPESEADHIFDRFKKLDSYKQGTGLGLYICRVIAEKLGGTLSLDRDYPRTHSCGCRFLFTVPINEDCEKK